MKSRSSQQGGKQAKGKFKTGAIIAEPNKGKSLQGWISTGTFLTFTGVVVAVVFGFVGYVEIFPLYVNLIVYGVGILSFVFAAWHWEATAGWRRWQKTVSVVLLLAVCTVVVYFPSIKQYHRETDIRLVFKESPLFSWWVRRRITHDVARFRQYLLALDIAVPMDTPPLDVYDTQRMVAAPLLYRGSLGIARERIHDRMAATGVYADYVFGRLALMTPEQAQEFFTATPPYFRDEKSRFFLGSRVTMSDICSRYFNWSFWERKPADALDSWEFTLWDIHEQLGGEFTDKLVANAMKVILDSPTEARDFGVNWDSYLSHSLKLADSIVESDERRWPAIEAVLKQHGKLAGRA